MSCNVVGCNYPESECSGGCSEIFEKHGIVIQSAKIVEIIKPEYYVESDIFGTKPYMTTESHQTLVSINWSKK